MKITAEAITSDWGSKCADFEPDCPTCQIWAMYEKIEQLTDTVEGLCADLDSAIEVAFKRGAHDWVRLNYPTDYERLKAAEERR